jgi:hypothetical protein
MSNARMRRFINENNRGGGAAPIPNPLWQYTTFLLHAPGEGVTTFTDSSANPKTITANGNIQGDTGVTLFGQPTILTDGTGDFLSILSNAAFGFGTADFSIEFFVRPVSIPGSDGQLFDTRTESGTNAMFYTTGVSGTLNYFGEGSGMDRWIASPTAYELPALTWTHVAVCRVSGNFQIMAGGNRVGQGSIVRNFGASLPLNIMANFAGTVNMACNFGEFRVLKGVSAYNGATYTVPTAPLPGEFL